MAKSRNLVFISHANPEENEFTRWLGLQLTRNGYQVWSDITKLIGGESFWADIEDAIRNYAIKFLFVLSRHSNDPDRGAIDELHLAKAIGREEKIKDFIIPLIIDDFPFSERNVSLTQKNVVDFAESWANGLARVLKKLERDNVPKNTSQYNNSTVSSWWKEHLDGQEIIIERDQLYLSNWFKIEFLPEYIYVHHLNNRYYKKEDEDFPCFRVRRNLISFASTDDLGLKNAYTYEVSTINILQNEPNDSPVDSGTIRRALKNILRQTWNNYLSDINLPTYMMSNDIKCFYFTDEILQGTKRITFDFPNLISGQRSLVGKFRKKTWHFGLSGNVQFKPELAYTIKMHVLFSEDGKKILESKSRLHSDRRSACKNWWNHHWRDRLMAAMYWIKQKIGEEIIAMPVSSSQDIKVSSQPILFTSLTDYDDNKVGINPFLDEKEPFDETIVLDADEEIIT
ncbi:MAG: toll/interleukin-1 receptor domain-containing protein [Sedimentisphaerales bacterium]|nr:toll/interleukin-1 receptor domain-containing protein [Sedimentisphaerales bacterium]